MNVYAFLLVPILMGVVLIAFYKHKVLWWELVIPVVYTVIFIAIAKWIAVTSLTTDTEYHSGYVGEVVYYEDWNERIHRTCCHKCGKSTCCHDCSYTLYHPERWEVRTTVGSFGISKQRYQKLMQQFKAKPTFRDMHRHYYTDDGDAYYGAWPGDDESLEPAVSTDTYENRPKASLSLFHYTPLDTTELKVHKPMIYPDIYDVYRQDCLLGIDDKAAHRKLQILNSRLGIPRGVKAFIIVYVDKPREAAIAQERFWEGGNRNEIVLCIGVDANYNVQWAHDFSWTDRQDFKVEVRSFAEQQSGTALKLEPIIDFMYQEVNTRWKEKDFKDFDYIHIEPTANQVIWIAILTIITNVLIGWWIVANEFDNEDEYDETPSWEKRYKKKMKYFYRY